MLHAHVLVLCNLACYGFMYEHRAALGMDAVISLLDDVLLRIEKEHPGSTRRLELAADNCSAQNKNACKN